jgi:hypothetical protein
VTPTDDLDRAIDEVATWIAVAGDAVLSFYDAERAGFVRDTVSPADEDGHPVIGRTSTSRAFLALLELLRFLAEEGSKYSRDLRDQALAAVRQTAAEHFGALERDPDRVRTSSQNAVNMFTDSHVLMAVTALHTAGSLAIADDGLSPLPPSVLGAMKTAAQEIWNYRQAELSEWRGGRVHRNDENHDFVTLHAVRAGDAFGVLDNQAPSWDPELGVRIRNSVLLQLGRNAAGITSQFDPAELAFSVALLHRFLSPDHQPITQHALQVIADEQTPDGAWPTSRLVAYGDSHLLFPASFEVALTLTDLLISQLDRDVHTNVDLLLSILSKSLRLVKNTFMADRGCRGWSNDRVRSPGRLESWATAIVLSFLVRYREALLRVRQARVLSRYEVTRPAKPSLPWPDLAPLLGRISKPNPDALTLVSDPTDTGGLRDALHRQFVAPVLDSPVGRPSKVSLLLPGPPGTRKTSMVQRLAEALGWPLLTLTPPDFLGPGGLEQFEATAAGVFRDLMRLRRVIVLFDECEDFFRKRDAGSDSAAGRTMGAFITAGMLPRLQRLHEQRWVIFVLATNAQLSELDPAVIRPGRFDFQQEMRNPPITAQRRYAEIRINDAGILRQLDRALADWAGRARPGRGHDDDQEITFVALDRLIDRVQSEDRELDQARLRQMIDELTKSGPPPLV